MIQADHPLAVTRRCALLDVARSTVYYRPTGISAEDLALMRRLDEIHLERPFYGSRRLRDELETQGHPVNRKRVQRLVRQMGLCALYPKPRTSQPAVGHTVYPYLLRGLSIERPNQVWATDICYIPMAHGFMYLGLYPDFPKSTNTLYLYILRAKLSVRPAQVDGIYVNIISHGSTPARTRACSDTTPRPDALYRALSRLDVVSDQAHVNVTHCQI